MALLRLPAPILYISSDPSFFGILESDKKSSALKDVTRIDFPIIEKGVINQENLTHALKSLDQEDLHLIVSDEIFHHHIADYNLDKNNDVEELIKQTVRTVFSDQKEPLHIVTVDLAKTSKLQTVQITALSKDNMATIQASAAEAHIQISTVLPASFVVKAFVSVDPSLFLLQTPKSFLLTSHYIGVDFAQNVSKDDVPGLTKLIKEIKKERAHIQHIYLCGEEKEVKALKESLEDVIPVQIVEIKEVETEQDTPFFLKALSMGMKDVVENDFPFPKFSVEGGEHVRDEAADATKDNADDETVKAKPEKVKPVEKEKLVEKEEKIDVKEDEVIEKPEKKVESATLAIETSEDETTQQEAEEDKIIQRSVAAITPLASAKVITPPTISSLKPATSVILAPAAVAHDSLIKPSLTNVSPSSSSDSEKSQKTTQLFEKATSKVILPPQASGSIQNEAQIDDDQKTVVADRVVTSSSFNKPQAKRKFGLLNFVFLTVGVAAVISLIGGGIVISQQALKDKQTPELQTPVTSVTPEEKPNDSTPTPKPTEAAVDLSKLNVLVVNATKISGKAGKIAALVKKAGVKKVETGNAKDSYDKGTFIMFAKSELNNTLDQLEKSTELSFEEKDYSAKEDPDKQYDIVIVLGE